MKIPKDPVNFRENPAVLSSSVVGKCFHLDFPVLVNCRKISQSSPSLNVDTQETWEIENIIKKHKNIRLKFEVVVVLLATD